MSKTSYSKDFYELRTYKSSVVIKASKGIIIKVAIIKQTLVKLAMFSLTKVKNINLNYITIKNLRVFVTEKYAIYANFSCLYHIFLLDVTSISEY